MAYYQQISNIPTNNMKINFTGVLRQYIEISFSGFASSSPYDKLKIETSPDNSVWTVVETHELSAAAGTLKTILNKVPRDIAWLRVKGYDSDGTTELTNATSLYKATVDRLKGSAKKKLHDIKGEAEKILKDSVDSSIVSLRPKQLNDKEMMFNAIKDAYTQIEANDSLDITETTITTGATTNGLINYPEWLRTQITTNKNWCINGTDMSIPHWIADDKIYTFKVTGSDNGAAKAKRCE